MDQWRALGGELGRHCPTGRWFKYVRRIRTVSGKRLYGTLVDCKKSDSGGIADSTMIFLQCQIRHDA